MVKGLNPFHPLADESNFFAISPLNDRSGRERIESHPEKENPDVLAYKAELEWEKQRNKYAIEYRKDFELVGVYDRYEGAVDTYMEIAAILIDRKHKLNFWIYWNWLMYAGKAGGGTFVYQINYGDIAFRHYTPHTDAYYYRPIGVCRLTAFNRTSTLTEVAKNGVFHDLGMKSMAVSSGLTFTQVRTQMGLVLGSTDEAINYPFITDDYPLMPLETDLMSTANCIFTYIEDWLFDNIERKSEVYEQFMLNQKAIEAKRLTELILEADEAARQAQTLSETMWPFDPQIASTYFGNVGWFTPATFQFWGISLDTFPRNGYLVGSVGNTLIRDGIRRSLFTIERTPIILLYPKEAFGRTDMVDFKPTEKFLDLSNITEKFQELRNYSSQFLSMSISRIAVFDGIVFTVFKEEMTGIVSGTTWKRKDYGSVMEFANDAVNQVPNGWIIKTIAVLTFSQIRSALYVPKEPSTFWLKPNPQNY